jgi:ferredoxin
MNVEVERALCGGMGICESLAPAYFRVGPDGYAVAHTTQISSMDVEDIEDAVSSCPNGALRFITT